MGYAELNIHTSPYVILRSFCLLCHTCRIVPATFDSILSIISHMFGSIFDWLDSVSSPQRTLPCRLCLSCLLCLSLRCPVPSSPLSLLSSVPLSSPSFALLVTCSCRLRFSPLFLSSPVALTCVSRVTRASLIVSASSLGPGVKSLGSGVELDKLDPGPPWWEPTSKFAPLEIQPDQKL